MNQVSASSSKVLDWDAKASIYCKLSGTPARFLNSKKKAEQTRTASGTFEAWSVPFVGGGSLRAIFIVLREQGETVDVVEGFDAAVFAQELGLETTRVDAESGEVTQVSWFRIGSLWVKAGEAVVRVQPWLLEANPTLRLGSFARRTLAPAVDPLTLLCRESPDDALESVRQGERDCPFDV